MLCTHGCQQRTQDGEGLLNVWVWPWAWPQLGMAVWPRASSGCGLNMGVALM